ncbi:DUF1028 domain-containing protein [Paraburkholderia rhizosphaerae]|uniref:Putative Ntn-hydrolase superfamily protein n=1 Tax=Paraburkholderia rhizosphaerae TaxID=480658 RepID=A0A4R8LZ56_9BURK|nr:DUF1028 domain-containing protein [Paraburkholderia rhizosphaerae]TDY53941.1 putative Ntn-hydrolase superfamily protein [Paraburkholderia rhizosphaerae]
MTFSIVARCDKSGALGVAVSTAVPAVGAMCVYVRAGVGAVSTQSWVNPYLALTTLDLLESGADTESALAQALGRDPAADLRQIGAIGHRGHGAAWTGVRCTDWAGQRTGAWYAIQGNMLVGAATLDAMQASFEATRHLALEERLMQALEAGQAAGGDMRGRQSAALKVVRDEAYAWVDLRVDEHENPVAELRRVFDIARQQMTPFVEGMPTRDDPGRAPPPDVTRMLLMPPLSRPGATMRERDVHEHDVASDHIDQLARWIGVDFADDRVAHNLSVYRSILTEIDKLRTLDLADRHPAVVFDVKRLYRTDRSSGTQDTTESA